MAERELLPHQRRLVDEYREETGPKAVALDAPPGTGKSLALMTIARDRAVGGELVIVVVRRALVAQWTSELERLGAIPSAVYQTPAELRLAWDTAGRPWPERGVVLVAAAVLRAPIANKAAKAVVPALLIIDDVTVRETSNTGRAILSLAERAGQILATTDADSIPWYPSSQLRRWSYPLRDNEGRPIGPQFTVRIHDYDSSREEADLAAESLRMLDDLGYPFTDALATRPAIQSALLGLARRIEAPERVTLSDEEQLEDESEEDWLSRVEPGAAERLWSVLDRFDDLTSDGRLTAVEEEVVAAEREGRPVVVVTERLRELEYVATALAEMGIHATTVSGRDSLEERAAAVESLQQGGVRVATPVLFGTAPRLPDGTRNVWYTPPRRSEEIRRRLGLSVNSRGVEIVLLRATPPVTAADTAAAALVESLQNFGRGQVSANSP